MEPPPGTGILARIKRRADELIHHPITEITLVVLILVSVGLILAEAAFDSETRTRAWIAWAGDLLTWLFVVELSIRAWVAKKRTRFLRRYWLDILAVLPLVRPLRLFRVVRLLRLFRAGLLLNRRLAIFQGVFRGVGSELLVLLTVTTILVLAAAVTLHLGERGVNPAFQALDGSVWFSLYSLVGGEPIGGHPATNLGRAVTLMLMLGGLTIFGMFVGTVSATMVPRLSRRLEVNEMDLDELAKHVVICGWNGSGSIVLQELFSADARRPVVLVTEAAQLPENVPQGIPRERLYHVTGDFTRVEILEQAAIGRAAEAIFLSDQTVARSNQDRDARTVLGALTAERLSPGIFTCAELLDRQNETLLRRAGVEQIIVADEYSGYIIGTVGRTHGLVATLDEILSVRSGNAFYKTEVPKRLDGETVGALHTLLKTEHEAILVSLHHHGEGSQHVHVNPAPEMTVRAGDHLVVIATQPIRW